MAKEIDPRKSKRAVAFELWMKASNPMVTFLRQWMSQILSR